jgi:hypothetical protein
VKVLGFLDPALKTTPKAVINMLLQVDIEFVTLVPTVGTAEPKLISTPNGLRWPKTVDI